MDSRPSLGGDLIPHGVCPDEAANALPAGAGDAHCQEGHRPKAFMDDIQAPAHRPLRVPGCAEILVVDQRAVPAGEHQIRAGGAHINPQDAPIRRDGTGGRGDRRKCTGKHTQRRLTAHLVPTFQRPAA